jgi:predicted transcriptional regulator of viral defense system
MERERAGYADTLGVRLLRGLAEAGHYVFTTADAREVAAPLGIGERYLSQLLPHLVDGGWLTRLRRGLYAQAGLLPGEVSLSPFVVATRLVSPAAISHWSAMSHHGLTEQIPQNVMALTPRKVVTPSMRRGQKTLGAARHAWEVGGIRYEYTIVKPEHYFGIEEIWIDAHFRVPITDRERTVLDGFIAPRLLGGMGEVLGTLEEHAEDLDLEKLVAYARRYGKASVAKRLGMLLERLEVPEPIWAPLAALPIAGFRVLDPTRPACGPYDQRWMIQNNLTPTGSR